jgi:hypothetical protein
MYENQRSHELEVMSHEKSSKIRDKGLKDFLRDSEREVGGQ